MRPTPTLAFAALLLLTTGCHSAFVDATLRNTTGHPVSLVELDYPSASFGTQTLAPDQEFHYRFKVLGSGDLKLLYTDSGNHDLKYTGPHLGEGDEGALLVNITPAGAVWSLTLQNRPTR